MLGGPEEVGGLRSLLLHPSWRSKRPPEVELLLSLGQVWEWLRKASGLESGLRQGCVRRRGPGSPQEEAEEEVQPRRPSDSSTALCASAVAPRVRRAAPSVHSGVIPGRVVPSSSLSGCSQGVGGGCGPACWDWRPVLHRHVLEVEGLSFRSRGLTWNCLSAWRPFTQQVVQEPDKAAITCLRSDLVCAPSTGHTDPLGISGEVRGCQSPASLWDPWRQAVTLGRPFLLH